MNRRWHVSPLACAAAVATLAATAPSHAFNMIQNFNTGRQTSGSLVACNHAGGFTHWSVANTNWYHNTALQGAGKDAQLFNAMSVWAFVPFASHTLTYKGRLSAGFVTDGFNVASWGTGQGCSGSCLALTALVLNSGQVIIESDVTFNNAVTWTTNGANFDTWAVAAHEFGHRTSGRLRRRGRSGRHLVQHVLLQRRRGVGKHEVPQPRALQQRLDELHPHLPVALRSVPSPPPSR